MLLYLGILLFAISLGATGQVLLKSGLRQMPDDASTIVTMTSMFRNIRVFSGLACYVVSTLFYLVALKQLPLSYAYPMIATSYVLVVILSWKFFGEQIPTLRIVAVATILCGVVLLALSYEDNEAQTPPSTPAAITGEAERDL